MGVFPVTLTSQHDLGKGQRSTGQVSRSTYVMSCTLSISLVNVCLFLSLFFLFSNSHLFSPICYIFHFYLSILFYGSFSVFFMYKSLQYMFDI